MTKDDQIARRETLRKAAIMGLETQLYRLQRNNALDMEELKLDVKRALRFIKEEA